jgi:FKBP-type peptidyl-prolyl cis-trans isomerase SlyD
MALRLKLKVRDVREASDDEIAAGTLGTAGITVLNTAPPGSPTH